MQCHDQADGALAIRGCACILPDRECIQDAMRIFIADNENLIPYSVHGYSVKFVVCHNAEVRAPTLQSPKEVAVSRGVRHFDITVGKNDLEVCYLTWTESFH